MPTALFTVKATITPEREKAFNEWYNHEHIPDVFKFKGVVSARRYKATQPEDRFQYVTVYEFESEDTLQRFRLRPHDLPAPGVRQALRRRLRPPARHLRAGLAIAVSAR